MTSAKAVAKDKPDLEALLSQLQQPAQQSSNHSMVMAELAACKPIPPQNQNLLKSSSSPPIPVPPMATLVAPPMESVKKNIATPSKLSNSMAMPCTPEISDMEDDLMSYEMEMNRIDFHNDLAFLLDQIEKDFESPCIGNDFRLDTPPDSDCETTENLGRLLNQMQSETSSQDLLGLDRFSQRIDDNSLLNSQTLAPSNSAKLAQSPNSFTKVGKLPPKTLAVLNKLPAKLFVGNGSHQQQPQSKYQPAQQSQQQLSILAPNNMTSLQSRELHRFVDVVKAEKNQSQNQTVGQLVSSLGGTGTQCIINIECRNPNQPAKIIQSFRAIDTGSEIKLVPADLPIKVEESPASKTVIESNNSEASPQQQSSHCPICNKCITNKNMARHLEKHNSQDSNDRKFICKYCCKAFSQRSHLSRHVKAHTSVKGDLLTCRVCGKVCKNRMSLVRHRAKHLACIHCSALFENKANLQDHLLKAHPEMAIVSLVQPPEQDPRLDLDDLGSIGSAASHSVDFSFSPSGPIDQPEMIGESLADIADSNYFFCGASDITDDLYSTDIFSAATAQTC